jgi:hypothetical protein
MPGDASDTGAPAEVFDIAADRADCVGVAPMKCLVVNGEYFYDGIEGYTHVDGQAARICVAKTPRPEPLPMDAGAFTYKRVDCAKG